MSLPTGTPHLYMTLKKYDIVLVGLMDSEGDKKQGYDQV